MEDIKTTDMRTEETGKPIIPGEQKVVQSPPVPAKELETKTPEQK